MRTALLMITVFSAIAGAGCKSPSKRYNLKEPHVEEFTKAPDETRYNNPPEKGYTAPPPTKEFRPGPGAGGAGGGAGSGMGPTGMGR